jgi:hypothetical protein
MRWDHFTTLRNALWIGGGQWAGKTTVAGILADRHTLTHYHYDYHDSRGHQERRKARRDDADSSGPLEVFVERFAFVQDDLRALQSPRPILADGWGLRPELVAEVTSDRRRMVVMVPTEEFRQEQIRRLPRAAAAPPERVARDRLIAEDAVRQAERLGIRVIHVDGSRDAEGVADIVSGHFAEFV